MKENTVKSLLVVAFILGVMVISWGAMSLLVWLVCWGFDIQFQWSYVVGIWAASFLFNMLRKR